MKTFLQNGFDCEIKSNNAKNKPYSAFENSLIEV